MEIEKKSEEDSAKEDQIGELESGTNTQKAEIETPVDENKPEIEIETTTEDKTNQDPETNVTVEEPNLEINLAIEIENFIKQKFDSKISKLEDIENDHNEKLQSFLKQIEVLAKTGAELVKIHEEKLAKNKPKQPTPLSNNKATKPTLDNKTGKLFRILIVL